MSARGRYGILHHEQRPVRVVTKRCKLMSACFQNHLHPLRHALCAGSVSEGVPHNFTDTVTSASALTAPGVSLSENAGLACLMCSLGPSVPYAELLASSLSITSTSLAPTAVLVIGNTAIPLSRMRWIAGFDPVGLRSDFSHSSNWQWRY